MSAASVRPSIASVSVTTEPAVVRAEVRLDVAGQSVVGRATAPRTRTGGHRAAALATIEALMQLLAGFRCELDNVVVDGHGDHERVIVVVSLLGTGGVEQLIGAALVDGDPVFAAVRSTLDAVNRRFALLAGGAIDVTAPRTGSAADADAPEAGEPDVVSMASHQIRGPLGILVGSLQTAAEHWEELDDDARRQMVERGFGQSRRLLRRVENLLALAQSERGAAPDVDRRTVKVCDVIRHALVDARKLDGEVLVDCPEEFHAMVDPDHLTQIVGNFVDNAFRHGRPPVAVRASATDDAIEIAVIDHGDGIPDDHADGLFHLPGQNPTPVLTAGSGLGLYITRLLAEANGGAVHHAPNSPTGTQMIVRVPRAHVGARREA